MTHLHRHRLAMKASRRFGLASFYNVSNIHTQTLFLFLPLFVVVVVMRQAIAIPGTLRGKMGDGKKEYDRHCYHGVCLDRTTQPTSIVASTAFHQVVRIDTTTGEEQLLAGCGKWANGGYRCLQNEAGE
jgi:hypothetical protein